MWSLTTVNQRTSYESWNKYVANLLQVWSKQIKLSCLQIIAACRDLTAYFPIKNRNVIEYKGCATNYLLRESSNVCHKLAAEFPWKYNVRCRFEANLICFVKFVEYSVLYTCSKHKTLIKKNMVLWFLSRKSAGLQQHLQQTCSKYLQEGCSLVRELANWPNTIPVYQSTNDKSQIHVFVDTNCPP